MLICCCVVARTQTCTYHRAIVIRGAKPRFMTLPRTRNVTNKINCFSTKNGGSIWLRRRQRLLLIEEAMALQGIVKGQLDHASLTKTQQLMLLGGGVPWSEEYRMEWAPPPVERVAPVAS
jgi:hypothetical protein